MPSGPISRNRRGKSLRTAQRDQQQRKGSITSEMLKTHRMQVPLSLSLSLARLHFLTFCCIFRQKRRCRSLSLCLSLSLSLSRNIFFAGKFGGLATGNPTGTGGFGQLGNPGNTLGSGGSAGDMFTDLNGQVITKGEKMGGKPFVEATCNCRFPNTTKLWRAFDGQLVLAQCQGGRSNGVKKCANYPKPTPEEMKKHVRKYSGITRTTTIYARTAKAHYEVSVFQSKSLIRQLWC